MKQVSIQTLKARLSAVVAEVEDGQTVVITRHNTPVAQLTPVQSSHVHYGTHVGRGPIKPAVKRGTTTGRSLAVLSEDRGNR